MLVYFLQALQVRTLFDSSRILLWLTKVVLVFGLGAFCLDLQKGGYCWCVVYGSGYTYSSGKASSKVMAWGRVSRRPSPLLVIITKHS